MIEGRIIKALSGFYYVETKEGIYETRARGIFRKKNKSPLVGDIVDINITHEGDCEGVLENVHKRKNQLKRPTVANIDLAVITFALKQPNPNLSLMDRFIALAEREGLEILIVITKIDLDEGKEFEYLSEIYTKAGYKVIGVSSLDDINIQTVKEELKGKVSVFAGPSGAGKSSLLNRLIPDLDLKTGKVSDKIGRGKHTTRHAELVKLDCGGMVADTPGFSSLGLEEIASSELKDYFIEFEKFDGCKFGNKCIHENEPGCDVKNAVSEGKISEERYKSYLQLLNELRNEESRRYK